MKPKVLILEGFGINCERETEYGFFLAGAKPERVHLTQLIKRQKKLKDYQILVFPGGFSFGDDISAGKVMALKIKTHLAGSLSDFVKKGGLVLGICNGFQVLVKMGLLPDFNKNEQEVSLTFNQSGRFEDRWVYLKVNPSSSCVWTKGIRSLYLPVRHGEGRFVCRDEAVRKRLVSQNQIVLQYVDEKGKPAGYPWNPNGSEMSIAGICDKTGRIFGLMPHPEGFLFPQNHPRWTRGKIRQGQGIEVFKNGVKYGKI